MSVVDRDARDALIVATRSFMAGEIRSHEFDDRIEDAVMDTKDETARDVHLMLWGTYDDVSNHYIRVGKDGWDFYHRILLLLQSDAHVVNLPTEYVGDRLRWVAAASLVLYVAAFLTLGFSAVTFVIIAMLAALSFVISTIRSKRDEDPRIAAMTPFQSISEIYNVRKQVSNFTKQPYPERVRWGLYKRSWMEIEIWPPISFCICAPFWCALLPLILLAQCLPKREQNWYICMPADPSS